MKLNQSQPAAALTLLAAGVAVAAVSCKRPQGQAQPPPPVVEVQTVMPTNVPLAVEFIGRLDSPQNVEIRARVEAFVEEVLFTEGQEVQKGDPLFTLDKKPFQERLAAARGMLAEAGAALNKYQKDVARLEPLAEKRAIPQQDLDNAVASVDVGKANVLSAEARVESAMIDLGYCDVTAPIAGLIGAKEVSVGSLVGKGQPTLLATISTLDPIWFYCAISEVDYLRAERRAQETGGRLGELPVTLILADGSELPTPGKWVFLDRAVDMTTGTLRARAEFDNSKKVLRPGMFARARISFRKDQDSLLVPERALLELQGKNFVWVVGADNKAAQRAVKPGPSVGGEVVILEGIEAGERIIVGGVHKVHEGAPVQAVTAEQLAQAAAAQAQAAPKPEKE